MAIREADHPITSLMTRVVSDVAYLLQTEIRLAKAEISEKLSVAANGGTLLGIAAVLFLPGLFILLLAAVRWLEVAGMPTQWGFLLVGVIVTAAAAVLAVLGINRLKQPNLLPQRTIEQVSADLTVAKEHI
jgi:putative superfamily III holin-X